MITTNLTCARGQIDHADRLISETYRLTNDPKLFIPALKLIEQSLTMIEEDTTMIKNLIDAYDVRAVEFVRGTTLVFADENMHATSISESHVLEMLDRAKRAYAEAYR